jgi:hypothetical protein
MTRRLHRCKKRWLVEELFKIDIKSSGDCVGAGNIRIHGRKRASIPNYSVRKLIRKFSLGNILCVSDAFNVFVDEGAHCSKEHELTLKSGFISHFSPPSKFLWFLSNCVPSTVRRCCDVCAERLRVDPPISLRLPFRQACGSLRWLVRKISFFVLF